LLVSVSVRTGGIGRPAPRREPQDMTLEQDLAAIFRDILDLEPAVDLATVKYRTTVRWDSLAHMELITAIEERFDIVIDTVDIVRINSFPTAVAIIGGKYGAAA
jgi:acyl carrier protein